MTHLDGRVVIITGAGSGFGRLVASMCASRGARVVGADISEDDVNETVSAIRAAGGVAEAICADVTSQHDMDAAVALAVTSYGRVDVLVNNAGIMPLAFFADHAQAGVAWDKAIDVNFKGVVHGINAVYDQMIAQGAGHIVNISSIFGNAGIPGGAVYGATKAAVKVISDALRIETKGKIKVTTVKPTGVPGTGLGKAVINPEAVTGLVGGNIAGYRAMAAKRESGELEAVCSDPDDIRYVSITAEQLAEAIVYCIDQPWGLSISDITVRASGDFFVY
jgi:NADP-dependent 3-hydroxy acid dehydrogenase YdfG